MAAKNKINDLRDLDARDAPYRGADRHPVGALKPCAGVGGQPCAHGKQLPADVTRQRCPDCTLAERRRKFFARTPGKEDLLERIQQASPPSHTVEGQLTRWKDARALEHDDQGPRDALDCDRSPAIASTERKPSRVTGERPWWAVAPREGMTRTAEQQEKRMSESKEGQRLKPRVIAEEY